MSNNINGLNIKNIKGLNSSKQWQTDKLDEANLNTNSTPNKPGSPAEEVSLTDTAEKLRQLEAKIANQPIVDTQRVENIKKMLANGSYDIDASQTANKLMDFENLLDSMADKKWALE